MLVFKYSQANSLHVQPHRANHLVIRHIDFLAACIRDMMAVNSSWRFLYCLTGDRRFKKMHAVPSFSENLQGPQAAALS